ncbi:MAG: hypothetical protein ABIH37_05505 [archaeon]
MPIEDIAEHFSIPIGTRYIKGTAKWYRYCVKAKQNQKKAIEKHPDLYGRAGKIAQKKHPWIGKELGKKYGSIQGKINGQRLKSNSKYFSDIAKKLHEINPDHSRNNMRKAHKTMKEKGVFNRHQRLAALKCMEKNPNQLKEMSKIAHKKYPLALLALESRRKNYPYNFMSCYFDSDSERIVCKKLVEKGLIKKPIEKINVHFRIGRCHIDFFIKNKIFVEYHPIRKFGRVIETKKGYYKKRRELLDKNGFKNYPLVLITGLREIDNKIDELTKTILPQNLLLKKQAI